MSAIRVDLNTAVTVPINIFPLTDDTDFKTIESAVVYNAAGLTLVWNFVTSAGTVTQTAVTPANTGNYLWTNSGNGMYRIQIPASGGASINNNTAGYGWFSGVATGVLPWRGPLITLDTVADRSSVRGTVTAGATTTSIPTSSLNPAAAVTDQFKGRIVIFDKATTTANLRGQATDITASTSGGTLTVTALTTAPVSGDTFTIV